jgi:hypothetical protein
MTEPTPRTDTAEETVVTSSGRKPVGFVRSDFARSLELALARRDELLDACVMWLEVAAETGITSHDENGEPTPNNKMICELLGRIERLLK